MFAEVGVPAECLEQRFVNGFMYTRLRPLIGADKPPRKPPPTPVLWTVARVHPAFRSRNKQAAKTLAERPSNAVVQRWNDEIRPACRRRTAPCRTSTRQRSTTTGSQRHIGDLLDHLGETYELHFWLHGHDLGPIARYVHRSIAFGLEPTDGDRCTRRRVTVDGTSRRDALSAPQPRRGVRPRGPRSRRRARSVRRGTTPARRIPRRTRPGAHHRLRHHGVHARRTSRPRPREHHVRHSTPDTRLRQRDRAAPRRRAR